MTFTALVQQLETALRDPLPGATAHALMAPHPRRDWPASIPHHRVRQAAGLLLCFPIGTRPQVILTVRSHTLDRHGGQVSLPGGAIEPGETFEEAALREAHEEIGLATAPVRTLGRLTAIDIPISGFRLHPIVAAVESRPPLHPADGEVARILEIPVADLMDPARIVRRNVSRDGRTFDFPAFPADDTEIWGATAMVLAEFLVLLGWTGPQTTGSGERA